MSLDVEFEEIAASALPFASAGERLTAVVPAEPSPDRRTYLCAFEGPGGRSWLAFDPQGAPVTSRDRVREAIAIAAVCEIAEESIGSADGPRVASPEYLDRLGQGRAPVFATAIRDAMPSVDELAHEVEGQYKLPLT